MEQIMNNPIAQKNIFEELDLSDASVSSGSNYLSEGEHSVELVSVEVMDTVAGDKALKLHFADVNGKEAGHMLNLFNKASEQARDIAKGQLKGFLIKAEYPTPDTPFPSGNLNAIVGLKVNIIVGLDRNKKFHEVKSYKKYQLNGVANTNTGVVAGLDDDVPF
jgi:hypothetical protein